MYCGHPRLCVCLCVCVSVCLSVCLSAASCPHYCTDPDVTWRSGTGCPLVVHYWADLQSVHGLRCYGNTVEICVPEPSTSHAARTTHACGVRRRLSSPAMKSTRLLRAPFHFVHTGGVVTRTQNVSEYMLVLDLCLVLSLL